MLFLFLLTACQGTKPEVVVVETEKTPVVIYSDIDSVGACIFAVEAAKRGAKIQ